MKRKTDGDRRMKNEEIKMSIAAFWDQAGDGYDSYPRHGIMSEGEETAWMDFLNHVLPGSAGEVLDVGAGTGFLTLLLARMGYRVKSTDISEGMQNTAIRKAEQMGLTDRISFAIEDAEELRESDNQYDAVLNRHLLWTLPHPVDAVREWLRVTRPGGRVIIIDANWYQDSCDAQSSYENEVNDALPLTKPDCSAAEMLRTAGFAVEEVDLLTVEKAEKQMIASLNLHDINMCSRFAYIIEK